jgi:hypothetical protein
MFPSETKCVQRNSSEEVRMKRITLFSLVKVRQSSGENLPPSSELKSKLSKQ